MHWTGLLTVKFCDLPYPIAYSPERYPIPGSVLCPFVCIEYLSLEGMLNRKNGFGRRVLRPAMLSKTNGLASKLHQAIIRTYGPNQHHHNVP